MSAVPQKIVLKSTTKISLNDRFTTIQKMAAERPPQQQTVTATIRDDIRQQRMSTAKNRRLAQQMANRPTVQAALKLKNKSIKQRLGQSNIKARLTLRGGRGGLKSVRGMRSTRGVRGTMIRGGRGIGRGQSPRGVGLRGRGQRGSQRGGQRGMMRGGRGRGYGQFGGQSGGMRGVQPGGMRGGQASGMRGGRGGGMRGGRGMGGRGAARGGRGMRGVGGRGGRGGRFNRGARGGRGRGARGGRGTNGKAPTREDLDNQLDAYMSKTKSALDAELDSYMQQTIE